VRRAFLAVFTMRFFPLGLQSPSAFHHAEDTLPFNIPASNSMFSIFCLTKHSMTVYAGVCGRARINLRQHMMPISIITLPKPTAYFAHHSDKVIKQ
jgi:hypothetical protein